MPQAGNLLGDGLFGATRQRVLALCFGHPDQRFYQRQIIQAVGLGSGTVQRELDRLTQAGILTRTLEGHQTYFQANRQCPVFDELHGLIRKSFGVAGVIQAALAPLAQRLSLAFIFGSTAAGGERSSSDIDVLLVGEKLSMIDLVTAMAPAQKDLGREINPVFYPTAEFCRKLAEGQQFLSRITVGPKIFLIGNERELTRLAPVRVARGAPEQQARDRGPLRRRRSRP